MTRNRAYFPGRGAAAPAAKQKRRVSVAALGKKPRSVNYFEPITAHNEGPGEPRNTSSCRGLSPSAPRLVQPDDAAQDEKARADSEGEGGRAAFLFLPNLPRDRKRERGVIGDEAVASVAISWDPLRYSLSNGKLYSH